MRAYPAPAWSRSNSFDTIAKKIKLFDHKMFRWPLVSWLTTCAVVFPSNWKGNLDNHLKHSSVIKRCTEYCKTVKCVFEVSAWKCRGIYLYSYTLRPGSWTYLNLLNTFLSEHPLRESYFLFLDKLLY